MILYQVVKNQMNRMFRSGAVANIGQVPWSRRLERPNLIPSYKPTPTLPSASGGILHPEAVEKQKIQDYVGGVLPSTPGHSVRSYNFTHTHTGY